ncbi:hypothetical protein J2T15_000424 [Paenibacillus harenae]|uniref:Carboxypeptidase regulatory-like domain-containing protein n=2 Tax=Paenibacillus harenae TaxID=306543 RepID=A0ABT9TWB7_PAEHA|nr:hypothetical protein [Paenibacillus harenae]
MSQLRDKLVTRCSLVVSPVDVWTRRMPSGLSVLLEDIARKPVRKSDGTYLFLDVPAGVYTLSVKSPMFMPYTEQIDLSALSPLAPVVTVPLLPGPGYAYPAAATAALVRIVDEAGTPIAGADIEAYATEDAAARARVAQDGLKAGDSIIAAGSFKGKTFAGEFLLLRDAENEQLLSVAEMLPGDALRLERPIAYSFRRGALFMPAIVTRSGLDGTALLPFRGSLPPQFAVKAKVKAGGKAVIAELQAKAGEVAKLRTIVL